MENGIVSTFEDFPPPLSPTPVNFIEDDIQDSEMPYMFELRSTVSSASGYGEPQVCYQEASNMSAWQVKCY